MKKIIAQNRIYLHVKLSCQKTIKKFFHLTLNIKIINLYHSHNLYFVI